MSLCNTTPLPCSAPAAAADPPTRGRCRPWKRLLSTHRPRAFGQRLVQNMARVRAATTVWKIVSHRREILPRSLLDDRALARGAETLGKVACAGFGVAMPDAGRRLHRARAGAPEAGAVLAAGRAAVACLIRAGPVLAGPGPAGGQGGDRRGGGVGRWPGTRSVSLTLTSRRSRRFWAFTRRWPAPCARASSMWPGSCWARPWLSRPACCWDRGSRASRSSS